MSYHNRIGHPDTFIKEVLSKSSLMRIFEYVTKWRRYSDLPDYTKLRFGHLKGLDYDHIITISKGRGVRKYAQDLFEQSVEEYQQWLGEAGDVFPFDEIRLQRLHDRMDIRDYKDDQVKRDGENGTMILAKNKHMRSIYKILSDSNHPDAKEILEGWKDYLDISGETLHQDAPKIEWKDGTCGYSVAVKDEYMPVVNVYRRWDAKVLNQNVSIIQTHHAKDGFRGEFVAYIDLDTKPLRLVTLGYDFLHNNVIVVEALQKLMPTSVKFAHVAVTPRNTDLLDPAKLMLGVAKSLN